MCQKIKTAPKCSTLVKHFKGQIRDAVGFRVCGEVTLGHANVLGAREYSRKFIVEQMCHRTLTCAR